MRTIRGSGESELVINKSRFICALARLSDEESVRAFITERRKLGWNAAHHCTAYVLAAGQIQRSSDDGEPSGTAGVPMLEVLKHHHLTDTAAVVTRYFGGVKLGAGGLIRAYGAAVSQTLAQVGSLELLPMRVITVTADHGTGARLAGELRRGDFALLDLRYAAQMELDVAVPAERTEEFAHWLSSRTAGRADHEVTGETVIESS